jgi:hypothetical protein
VKDFQEVLKPENQKGADKLWMEKKKLEESLERERRECPGEPVELVQDELDEYLPRCCSRSTRTNFSDSE